MAEEQQGGFYRVEVIASLFGVTVRRVQQLTQEGIISTTKTKEGNRYELAPTIQRYVKYLSDKAYGKSKSEKEAELREQKLQAEIALKESQGEMHRLKTEIASGKYIDIEEVKMDYSRFFCFIQKVCIIPAEPTIRQNQRSLRPDGDSLDRKGSERRNHPVIKQLCGGRLHTGRNGKEKAWQEIRIVDTRSQNTRRKP